MERESALSPATQLDELAAAAAVAAADEPTLVGAATAILIAAGQARRCAGDYPASLAHFRHAVQIAVTHRDRADAARGLLALADELEQLSAPDWAADAKRAREEATVAAPASVAPLRARRAEREGDLADAERWWQEAIRLEPSVPDHRLALARLFSRSGRSTAALACYLDAMEEPRSLPTTLSVAARCAELEPLLPAPQPEQGLRIALLGNATLDHLQAYLRIACLREGYRPVFYQAGFDQYAQELLDPASGLYTFRPDLVICAIHASRIVPNLHDYPFDLTVEERRAELEAGIAILQSLLDAFSSRSSALLLLHTVVAPRYPVLGVLDLREEFGQGDAFAEINARLRALVRSRYRTIFLVDEDRVQSAVGKANATDPRLWLSARLPWSEGVLHALVQEYMRFVRALRGRARKCIVVDLDNTLWGGVVGEDGVEGVQIGPDAPGNAFLALQRELERLWRRGILLAICSKNNEADVLPVFEHHPGMHLRLSHFAARRINWETKVDNLRAIAAELNIGIDSLVFLDDNPLERSLVRVALPEVLTVELPADPAEYRTALLNLGVFDTLAFTNEDRDRARLYAEQRERQAFAAVVQGHTIEEHLAALRIRVEIAPADAATLPRIAQLTMKTNQFNLTTRRYTEQELCEIVARGGIVLGMRVADRFGDCGLTGVAITVPSGNDEWEIDTLLLSCRVMGRGVEAALVAHVAAEVERRSGRRLIGRYSPSAKNAPAQDCYQRLGFTWVYEAANGSISWQLDLHSQTVVTPPWLTIPAHALQ